jgi:hypothetical protein
MTLWSALDDQLEFMLGIASQVTAGNRMVAFNFAQRTFALQHTAKRKAVTYSDTECDSDYIFTLPTDLLDIHALYSADELCFMEEAMMYAGGAWSLEEGTASQGAGDIGAYSYLTRPYSFVRWPEDSIQLLFEPGTAQKSLKLYYWGYWNEVSGDTSILDVPTWSYEALLTYAVAMTYVPNFADAAWINEFKTRVDSGNPLQNPHEQAHKNLLLKYEWLLSKHPRQVREYAYRVGGRS